jgi:polyhydroxybutyrate depolymerase
MKTKLLIFVFSVISITGFAQTNKTINVGNKTRQYREYVASSYTGTNPVPLVICLHGLGDNMTNFSGIGMHLLSDSAQFITLYPQAENSSYGTAWNSGASFLGMTLNSNVDDIGFINALIDSTAAIYNIDLTRVYVTGFSMGGFMANRLACQLGSRICAIASVAGTIGTSCSCNPFRAIPVAHFHGTADGTVAYSGNSYGNDAEALVNYWVNFNNCDTPAIHSTFPDIATDNITVDLYKYINGNLNSEVWFFKANGANHVWLVPAINDISYTIEIWNFFKRFHHTTLDIENSKLPNLSVYPNPATDILQVNGFNNTDHGLISILDVSGRVVMQKCFENGFTTLNVSKLQSGAYILQLNDGNSIQTARFLKQ